MQNGQDSTFSRLDHVDPTRPNEEKKNMTAEMLWEKKEVVGIIAVIALFAGGLLFLVSMKKERQAWGEVEAVQQTTKGMRYDVLVRNQPAGSRLFREIIVKPSGRLAPLAEKRKRDQFEVRITRAGEEKWRIVEVAEVAEE